MACVTLKRSNAFDILGPSSPKRHRCSSSITCNCQLPAPKSVFTPDSQLTRAQIQRRLRDEVKRLQRRRVIPRFPLNSSTSASDDVYGDRPSSPEDSNPAACSSVITSMRSMAIRSPHSDFQLDSDGEQSCEGVTDNLPNSPPSSPSPASPFISPTILSFNSSNSNCSPSTTTSINDAARPSSPMPLSRMEALPLFTFPQVTALCDRLIREREDQLREEYDSILACKLAEQYQALLKFNQDQLCHRYRNAPMNYVS